MVTSTKKDISQPAVAKLEVIDFKQPLRINTTEKAAHPAAADSNKMNTLLIKFIIPHSKPSGPFRRIYPEGLFEINDFQLGHRRL